MVVQQLGQRHPVLDAEAPVPGGEAVAGGAFRSRLSGFLANRASIVGLAFVVLVVMFCFCGPLVYHTNQLAGNLDEVNMAPGARHLFGTDSQGFDILGRLMIAGQSSIEIGLAVAVVATTIGALYGAVSGYLGGAVDAICMRIVDTILSIPSIFLFIYLATAFRPTIWLLIIVLSALSWLVPARLVRGQALSLRSREFVDAARVMGSGRTRLVLRHVVPNTFGTVIVNATFQVADAILILALLSFFGFGLPPPAATWGGMLSNGINFIYDGYWWEIYPIGVLIVLTVLAVNLVGDALRDAFDVRLEAR